MFNGFPLQVCRLTGGQVYKYTYFQSDLDGERFISDLKHNISRPVVFDAIMRIRTSTGVRPTDFFGSFYMANTTGESFVAAVSNFLILVRLLRYGAGLLELRHVTGLRNQTRRQTNRGGRGLSAGESLTPAPTVHLVTCTRITPALAYTWSPVLAGRSPVHLRVGPAETADQ